MITFQRNIEKERDDHQVAEAKLAAQVKELKTRLNSVEKVQSDQKTSSSNTEVWASFLSVTWLTCGPIFCGRVEMWPLFLRQSSNMTLVSKTEFKYDPCF